MQKIIVRHKTTNFLYSTLDGKTYRNLITEEEREVPDELIQKCFAISLDATEMINEFPNVQRLIKELNLKIEPNEL